MNQFLRKSLVWLRGQLEHFGEKRVRRHLGALQSLPFFHNLYFGATGHTCPGWKSPDGMFHSDGPVAVVVTRGGKVSGVVGFEILGSTLLIRQLQGAPRGNFHDGTKVEAYLLECAEGIAKALRMKALYVVTPETAIAYRRESPLVWQPSEVAEMHMRKIYSYPARVGYAVRFLWRLRRPAFYRALS